MTGSYQDILLKIYQNRRNRNPMYSLSAFSRDSGFKSSHMNDILNGYYGLSPKRAVVVAEKLSMTNTLKQEFLNLVQHSTSKNKIDRTKATEKLGQLSYIADKTIRDTDFSIISEWYHLAILEIIRKQPLNFSITRVANQLDLSEQQVDSAISNLKKVGILAENNNVFSIDYKILGIRSQQEKSSSIIQKFHKQMISKSLKSMEEDSVKTRTFNSFNVNLSEEEYQNLTIEVASFIRKKIEEYDSDKEKNCRLYAVNMQVFPLEKGGPSES